MANCKNCGAPLSGTLLTCEYCRTRQDVDLSLVHRFTVEEPCSKRICPRCHIPLQTVDLRLGEKFLIERCERCLGLFFDPGELEAFLNKAVTNVHAIDPQRLNEVQNVKRRHEYPVTYIDCPVCRRLMNRINLGSRSGVIADQCREHGLWLDGGELRQLMEWMKAGGKMLHREKELEMARLELEQEKKKVQFDRIDAAFSHTRPEPSRGPQDMDITLLPLIGRLVRWMFR
ncbi:MAG: zf-TFIIB domain-containing protein [Candidatus Aminicenantes bacterium]|nr:zf-TFIIB domain-containing protein [Candidatus Aminicenantes bacterium]